MPFSIQRSIVGCLSFCALMIAAPVAAQKSPDDVLAENATIKLTRADYEIELSRLPATMRDEFATSPKRLTELLNNLLIAKTLAADARKAGIEREPATVQRVALEMDRFLSQLQIQRIEEAAGREFDAQGAQMLAKAKERYLVETERYRVPENVAVSHILFSTKTRTDDAARALAQEARGKLVAGADFAALAREVSEDPTAKENGGHLDFFSAGKMDPAFSKAAFAMKNVGDLSEPVKSRYGYHIIRFEGRHEARKLTFDQVKPQIMAELRKSYVDDKREARIGAILNDPSLKVNQAAVDALVVKMPDSAQMRPK